MKSKTNLGQYIIDNYGEEFFDTIWSDKNNFSPFNVAPSTRKYKAWFNCPKGIHDSEYRTISCVYTRNFRCPKCSIIEQHLKQLDDLTGQKFGKWTVVKKDEEESKRVGITYWLCDCDCGTKNVSVSACTLKSGNSKSCGCRRHEYSGENHWNWQDGKTSDWTKQRNSYDYRKWREKIFELDNYTCQCCGKRGGKLNAHHVFNFADNEEMRFDLNNGITLCEECHAFKNKGSFHDLFGTKNNTKEQLEEYITDKWNSLGSDKFFIYEDFIKENRQIKEDFLCQR